MNSQPFKFYNKLIAIVILFSTFQLNAQENNDFLSKGKPTFSYSILTNGLFKNPGVNFRYERPIFFAIAEVVEIKERKKRKTREYRKIRELNLNGNLGFYWDPYTHIATYTTAGILYRKTNRRNRQWMIGINPLGYMRTFLHEAYEVDDNLTVSRKKFAGRSYYAPELILGTGKIKGDKARFFNIHLMFLRKYNLDTLPLIHFEFGYRF